MKCDQCGDNAFRVANAHGIKIGTCDRHIMALTEIYDLEDEAWTDVVEVYTTAKEDLAKIIAQITSGVKDSIPEQDDFDLAAEVEFFIDSHLKRG
jgi:hypothetical protein